ncbi:uncharacterized protein LOC117124539 [Anneissia japonica]|uniref:uncharacterized protein LOC117124539 n=1 Tax=Anneissia japonica TaxID=1529436 RepID=UPI001425954F|nr:uncharacterized protein LOC117124539 [Anneissia japonica]
MKTKSTEKQAPPTLPPAKTIKRSLDANHISITSTTEEEASATSIPDTMPDIPNEPNQPRNITFEPRLYGKKKQRFQPSWFDTYPWLHYREHNNSVLCHLCVRADIDRKLFTARNKEAAFLKYGFANWKKALDCFESHEKSTCHQLAAESVVILPNVCKDIGETISRAHQETKLAARKNVAKIVQNLRFLGRQGLAVRGDSDKNEENSNFNKLFRLKALDDPTMNEWLEKKN